MTDQTVDLYGDPQIVLRRVVDAIGTNLGHASDDIPERCKGALYYRQLDDVEIAVYPLIAGTVRITVGETGAYSYEDAWCYSTPVAGIMAAASWDGTGDPPDGWFRNISTGRRRPEGDPSREYVHR